MKFIIEKRLQWRSLASSDPAPFHNPNTGLTDFDRDYIIANSELERRHKNIV
jgi:hypothetical protein